MSSALHPIWISGENDSDSDDENSTATTSAHRRIDPTVTEIEGAFSLIRKRYHRLVMQNCTLYMDEMRRLSGTDNLKTTITLGSISIRKPFPETLTIENIEILQSFQGLRLINSLQTTDPNLFIFEISLLNLQRLSLSIIENPQQFAMRIQHAFPHLHNLHITSRTPARLQWFAQLQSLQTLRVNSVCDNNGANPPPKTIRRLHLEDCSKAETFNFLPYLYAFKELYISQAPDLQVGMLRQCLDRCPSHLQSLSLAETDAVNDELLDVLLHKEMTLKRLEVPLLAGSKCLGFSNESLSKYMNFNNGLEELIISGHRYISSTIWRFPVEWFEKLKGINVCQTNITTMEHLSEFARNLLRHRSIIDRLKLFHKPHLIIGYDGEANSDLRNTLQRRYNLSFY
jgi:hypothetical protein